MPVTQPSEWQKQYQEFTAQQLQFLEAASAPAQG
jgi:formate dehydrogenase major subunit